MMPLTLKQAVEYLAASPTPYKLPTLRKAIKVGRLKTKLIENDLQSYRVVEVKDLVAWAEAQSKSTRGNPTIRNVKRKHYPKKASKGE